MGFANLFANELVDNQGNWDELDEGVKGWNPLLRSTVSHSKYLSEFVVAALENR